MKKIITLIFLLCSLVSGAVKYYCSPAGSDVTGTGTLANPYFSINAAFTVMAAGDTIYMRGGIYHYNIAQDLRDKANIRLFAYPGESPVMNRGDGYVQDPDAYFDWIGMYISNCDNIHVRGLDVSYYPQFVHDTWGAVGSFGVWCTGSDAPKFENCSFHHNGGGLMLNGCKSATVLNCDFYRNQDPLSEDAYGGADGLVLREMYDTTSRFVVRGCRAWWNTDDGFDFWYNDGYVTVDSCWSFYNGYIPGTMTAAGDGSGFKNGSTTDYSGIARRKYTNCMAVFCRSGGFDNNGALCLTYIYNSLSYHNTRGMTFNNGSPVLRNVIAYANTAYNTLDDKTNWDHQNNSWNGVVTISDADFQSLDTSLLDNARNGVYLPAVAFGKLAAGSDAIDAGANVGLSYSGTAPDIGAWEYGYAPVIPAPAVTTKKILKHSGKVIQHNGKFIVR